MEKKNSNVVAIVTMIFMFAMISFVTNMAAPFGNIWRNHYEWAGMLGNMMNFLAYLFMGIPAGKMLSKIGYKKTALIALAVGFVGMVIQYLSSRVGADVATFSVGGQPVMLNYVIYLLGAFVCGFCVCMLNTVVNPMLNILGGGGNRGNQLIQTGGTFNSLTGTLTPLLVGALIGQVTDKTAMSDVAPLLFIAMGVFALAFIIICCVKFVEPNLGKLKKEGKDKYSAWSFRHLVLGVVAIFFYVGIEVGIPNELNFYLTDDPACGAAIGGAVAAIYWLLMMVGRALSTAISGKVSTKAQLSFVSLLAIILIIVAIILPDTIRVSMPGYSVADGFAMFQVPISALFLVLCGLCTSLMWGGIFNLSVEGLGKYTEQASGIFMMMVVGGGVMPFIQNAIAKGVGYMGSYWLVVAMLAYILFYAMVGCKNVNKDIPVE
ncbi:MAG: MFS transporter [Bacteroidales bacterium]|jgi:FHS family L-fucose permease-like MFS transporter|nr:MFS transporter [Bacteroidales bacterium]MBR3985766.1 MFS transporter [Bacteroidales bacterium]